MSKAIVAIAILIMTTQIPGCSKNNAATQSPVERGKYLVTFGGCNDCHTPKIPGPNGAPMPDGAKLLTGHPGNLPPPSWSPDDMKQKGVAAATNGMLTAWAGPWGVSFATNLTADKETGIGEWTEEMFIKAMRTGKHQGQPNGRDILPPMPWFNLNELSDSDLAAIWSYLRSLPPVKNQVPFPIPPSASTSGGAR
jgi:mono/diheme cytochrome c family protein